MSRQAIFEQGGGGMELNEEFIRCAVRKELDARRSVDERTHKTHHDFVADMIERRRRRRELWSRVSAHVLGWGAIAIIVGLISLLGDALLNTLRYLLKPKGGP